MNTLPFRIRRIEPVMTPIARPEEIIAEARAGRMFIADLISYRQRVERI